MAQSASRNYSLANVIELSLPDDSYSEKKIEYTWVSFIQLVFGAWYGWGKCLYMFISLDLLN